MDPDLVDASILRRALIGAAAPEENHDDGESPVEAALAANLALEARLERLRARLAGMLAECRADLAVVRESLALKEAGPVREDRRPPARRSCGRPYFKDLERFPAPPNADARRLDAADLPDWTRPERARPWTEGERRSLALSVDRASKEVRRRDAAAEIRKAERLNPNRRPTELVLLDHPTKRAALPLEDSHRLDWDLIAGEIGGDHTPFECRTMWKMFVHPQINRKPWSHEEKEILADVDADCDWEALARSLGTGRTAYQCLVYRMTRGPVSPGAPWTPEEDEYLKSVVECCRIGGHVPWAKVSFYVEGRTKEQIYSHWTSLALGGDAARDGRYSREEDAVIAAAMRLYGDDFRRIAAALPGRTTRSVRERHRRARRGAVAPVRRRTPAEPAADLEKSLARFKKKLERVEPPVETKPHVKRNLNTVDHDLIRYFERHSAGRPEASPSSTRRTAETGPLLRLLGARLRRSRVEDLEPELASAARNLLRGPAASVKASVKTYSRKNKAPETLDVPVAKVWTDAADQTIPYALPPAHETVYAIRDLVSLRHVHRWGDRDRPHEEEIAEHPDVQLWKRRFEAIFAKTSSLVQVKCNINMDLHDGDPATARHQDADQELDLVEIGPKKIRLECADT